MLFGVVLLGMVPSADAAPPPLLVAPVLLVSTGVLAWLVARFFASARTVGRVLGALVLLLLIAGGTWTLASPDRALFLTRDIACDRANWSNATMKITEKQTLWLRWVVANAFGELLGLGATFAVIAYLFVRLESQNSVIFVLTSFVVAVLSGALEATIVGLAQWWALHSWFPAITRRSWWIATLVGALVAYVLGYLPSTLMSFGEEAGAIPVAEPPHWMVLLLAAGLGAVGGAGLSFAQWRVLRKHVAHAGWWIPANMLAWLVGMPIIFWAIDAAQKGQSFLQTGFLIAAALLVTGAVVGGIHGAFLVKLAPPNRHTI